MTETLYALAVLACPVGMGLMMWLMMRSGHGSARSGAEHEQEVQRLRAEVDQMRAAQAHRKNGIEGPAVREPDRRQA
jgi:hypothetical protein